MTKKVTSLLAEVTFSWDVVDWGLDTGDFPTGRESLRPPWNHWRPHWLINVYINVYTRRRVKPHKTTLADQCLETRSRVKRVKTTPLSNLFSLKAASKTWNCSNFSHLSTTIRDSNMIAIFLAPSCDGGEEVRRGKYFFILELIRSV